VVNSVSDVGNIQNTVLVTWFITSDLGQSTDLDFHWYTADAGIAVVQGSEMVWLNTTIPTGGTWLVQATPTRSTPSFNSTKLAGVSLPPVETRWTVGTFGALPVQMTKFTAMSERMGAELQWSTATEVNCYGFEVERRMTSPLSSPYQGSGWQKIGFVQGAGTSNSPKNYSYTDASVASGTYAYRLKQIDNDGTFEYSSEAEITLSVPKVLALNQNYPNPFNPSTTINFTLAEDSHVSLRVFDMLGREVATLANSEMKAVEVHNVLFDASRLSSGLYFYRLDAGKSSLVKKLMLLK
jgi:hypothetical protein